MFGSRFMYNPGVTYAVTASTLNVYEGQAVTYYVFAPTTANGTTLYWSTTGTVVAADFTDSTLTGSFTINSGIGSFTRTLVYEGTNEVAETMTIQIRTGSVSGTIVATADTVTVNDGVSITGGTSLEGTSATFTLSYKTTSYPFYWEVVLGTATADDFTTLNGTVTTGIAGPPATATINVGIANDLQNDSGDTYYLQIRDTNASGNIMYTSSALSITQPTATFAVLPQSLYYNDFGNTASYTSNAITEGISGTFIVTMPTWASTTTTLYWTTLNNTTTDSDFTSTSGSFVTSFNGANSTVVGTFSIPVASDNLSDPDRTFQAQIRWGSNAGYVLATSSAVTIKQQEVAFATPVSRIYDFFANTSNTTANAITEGGTGTFNIQTKRSYSESQPLYWTILHGNTSNSDFASVSGSFTTSSYNPYGGGNAIVNITTVISDSDVAVDETFQLQIRENSITGPVIGTSTAITIKQQEVAFATPISRIYDFFANTSNNTGNAITEGGTGTFNIQTKRSYSETQTLYWTILHGNTSNSDFSAVEGNFTTSSYNPYGGGNAIVNITTVISDSDVAVDETFQLQIRENSNTGPVIGTSQVITIKQQEVAFATPVSRIYDFFANTSNNTGNAITEGGTGTFNIQTKRSYSESQTLYWTILHGNTSNSDFASVSGSFTTSSYNPYGGGNGLVNITTLISDGDVAVDETFQLQIRENSITGPVIGTSNVMTIKPQEIAFAIPQSVVYTGGANTSTATANATTEGSTLTWNIQTKRSYSETQTLYWTILHGNTSNSDFSAVEGSFTTSSYSPYGGGNGLVNITTVISDSDVAVDETFQLQIRENSNTGPVIGTSQVITIKPQEIYFINPGSYIYGNGVTTGTTTANAITEGTTGQFGIQTIRSYSTSQTLYWTILHGTTVDSDFANVNGSLTTGTAYSSFGGGFVYLPITTILDNDGSTDETFQLQIRENSITGPVIGTSTAITIKPQEIYFTNPGSYIYTNGLNTGTITANAITEGSVGQFGIQTTRSSNVSGQTLYWTISHITTSNADFTNVSGSFATTSSYSGSVGGGFTYLNIPTVITDNVNDVDETFQLQIRELSTTGPVIGTSATITIKQQEIYFTNPGSYIYNNGLNTGTITANAITEGSVGQFGIQTTRSYDTYQTLYWTILHGTTVDADFTNVSGSFATTNNYSSSVGGGFAYLNIPTVITDNVNDVDETFQLQIRENSITGPVIGTSTAITIKQQEIYFTNPGSYIYNNGLNTGTSTANAITEGSVGQFGIQTKRSYDTYQTLYWTISHITTVDADFTNVSGSFTTTNNYSSSVGGGFTYLNIPTVITDIDPSVDETFQLQIRELSTTGPVIGTSAIITIKPQEVYFINPSSFMYNNGANTGTSTANAITEGSVGQFGIQTKRSYDTNQTLYWTILHGTTVDADFANVNGSFATTNVYSSSVGGGFVYLNIPTVITDNVNDVDETFQLQIRESSITGPVIGTSSAITIKQQEVYFISLATTVSEGSNLSVNLQVKRPYSSTQTLYWTILHGTTSDSDFTTLNGSITIASNTTFGASGTFSVPIASDIAIEVGETFQLQIRENSITGPVIGTSASVTITAQTPTFIATSAAFTVGQSSNAALYTTDGTTWTAVALPSNNLWVDSNYNPGNVTRGVAVAWSSTSFAYTSNKGAAWTAATAPSNTSWLGCAPVTSTIWIAINDSNSVGHAYSTDNGVTWSQGTLITTAKACAGNGAGVAAVVNGTLTVNYTTNGTSFSTVALAANPGGLTNFNNIVYVNGIWIIMGNTNNAGRYIYISTNGTTWSNPIDVTGGTAYNMRAINWNGSMWIIVCDLSATYFTSPDLVTWTQRSFPNSRRYSGIGWFSTKWVAIVDGENIKSTSTDGISWTETTISSAQRWMDLTTVK